jgi:predicted GTPase
MLSQPSQPVVQPSQSVVQPSQSVVQADTQPKITETNAMLVGCVSSGKSSLLNALAGGIISPASKDRQTFKPTRFRLARDGRFKDLCEVSRWINDQKTTNMELFKQGKIKEEEISTIDKRFQHLTLPGKNDLFLTDCPGMGDSCFATEGLFRTAKQGDERDAGDMFLKSVLNNICNFNLVMFVCDANKPFLQKEEVNLLKKIQAEIKKQLDENQTYCELIILVCKYDDLEDEELAGMFANIPKITGVSKELIFRVNSYQLFSHWIIVIIFLTTIDDFVVVVIQQVQT